MSLEVGLVQHEMGGIKVCWKLEVTHVEEVMHDVSGEISFSVAQCSAVDVPVTPEDHQNQKLVTEFHIERVLMIQGAVHVADGVPCLLVGSLNSLTWRK